MTQQTFRRTSHQSLVTPAVALNIVIAAAYIALWIVSVRQDIYRGSDFTAFYTGWSIVYGGQGAHLYDAPTQMAYQRMVLDGGQFKDGLLPYLNPPYATLVFVPLAALPLLPAFVLWTLAQFALLGWLIYRVFKLTATWQAVERRLLMSMLISFPALFLTLILGTFSLLMLVSLLEWYIALREGRDARAAVWLVVATIKFQVIGLPVLMLLVGRRWKVLGFAALVFAALAAVSALLLGWRIWPDYVQFLGTASTYFGSFGIKPHMMYTFRGLLTTILGNTSGPLINTFSVVAFGLAALGVTWLWWRPWDATEPAFDLRVALTILLGLFFSPHLYPHDAMMLVAPGLLFANFLKRSQLPLRRYGMFALCSSWAMVITEVLHIEVLPVRLPILVMFVLAVWLGFALRRADSAKHATVLRPTNIRV